MVATQLGRGKLLLAGLAASVFSVLLGVFIFSTPVHADPQPANNPQAAQTQLQPGRGDEEKVCTSGDGLAGAAAYVLCPFTQIVADATAFFEKNILIPFMTISPLTTNEKNATYILWQNVRSLANIGFILFFFFIILSQATSLGLSNYGIKKALPRLLIVAIGINLSYFFVAFIIDAFNIFGAGISQLVLAALKQGSITQTDTGTSPDTAQYIFVIGGTLLAAVVATAGAAIGWLFGLIGLAFLFVLVTVVILVIRQIAIIMLVIIAPVAILMYMLPNTEHYYDKWRKNLTQLLMMYPLLVLLFAAGKIFSVIINQPDFKIGLLVHGFAAVLGEPLQFLAQATTGGNTAVETVSPQIVQGVKAGLTFFINALPLGGTPLVWAGSGFIMNKAGGFLHGKIVAPRIQSSKDKGALLAQEAQMRATKVPVLGRIAGRGLRKKATLAARQHNLQHSQEQYVADRMANSPWMRYQAGGVAGSAGRTRAAAGAAGVAAKGRKQDIENESALLEAEMRRLGFSSKQATSAVADYLTGKSDGKLEGINGQKLDLDANRDRYMRGMLNLAASQGEVGAVEAARLDSRLDQTMVDDVIRANEGKLKEKGGYHLATDYNLAAGRKGLGDTSSEAGMEQAKIKMEAQRIVSMANSGANSIAGMKAGVLMGTEKILSAPAVAAVPVGHADRGKYEAYLHKQAVLSEVDRLSAAEAARTGKTGLNYRTQLQSRMSDIVGNNNTLAKADVSKDTFNNIASGL